MRHDRAPSNADRDHNQNQNPPMDRGQGLAEVVRLLTDMFRQQQQ